jgi:hypothetical protein
MNLRITAPIGVAMRLSAISVVLCGSLPALAFDVDGYSSGMSVEQLINLANVRGEKALKVTGDVPGQGWVVTDSKGGINASLFFCDNHLQIYNHPIDFDAEYWQTLRSLLTEHGQPTKVEAQQQLWLGSGGGYVTHVSVSWRVGVDEITLDFNPEGRDGRGNLRYSRSASVIYRIADARCP